MEWFVVVLMCAVVCAQDCKVGGQRCADDEQCCGGCCIQGECIDTYRSCQSIFDVCRGHTCHGEENCVSFTPPNCPGCEPVALCRITT